MAENEEKLKNLLMRVKEESAKNNLKLNIKIMKVMATGPITSVQIERGRYGGSDIFYFLGLHDHYKW